MKYILSKTNFPTNIHIKIQHNEERERYSGGGGGAMGGRETRRMEGRDCIL